MSQIEALVEWIRRTSAPAKALIVPVSGGSDSAICFWALNQAYPEKVIGVHAGKDLVERTWFDQVGRVECIETPGGFDEREEMRWGRFLAMSLATGAWLVGCRNRTEDALGTYSLASRVATYLPLVGVWKSDVLSMCAKAGVPQSIVASSLRADPDCGRPQSLAEIPYQKIELFLRVRTGEGRSEELAALAPGQLAYLDRMYAGNRFKSDLPIRGPLITSLFSEMP